MKKRIAIVIGALLLFSGMTGTTEAQMPTARGSFFSRPSRGLLKRWEVRENYEQRQLPQYQQKREQLNREQERLFQRQQRTLQQKVKEEKHVPVACPVFRRVISRLQTDILKVIPDNIETTETRQSVMRVLSDFLEGHCATFPLEDGSSS